MKTKSKLPVLLGLTGQFLALGSARAAEGPGIPGFAAAPARTIYASAVMGAANSTQTACVQAPSYGNWIADESVRILGVAPQLDFVPELPVRGALFVQARLSCAQGLPAIVNHQGIDPAIRVVLSGYPGRSSTTGFSRSCNGSAAYDTKELNRAARETKQFKLDLGGYIGSPLYFGCDERLLACGCAASMTDDSADVWSFRFRLDGKHAEDHDDHAARFKISPATASLPAQVSIGFDRFAMGGDILKLNVGINGVKWGGNFKLAGCHASEGLRQAKPARMKSVSELVAREGDWLLPGYKVCEFQADVMTTETESFVANEQGTLLPNLRNARILMGPQSGGVEFEAWGRSYKIAMVKNGQGAIDASKQPTLEIAVENLIGELRGAIPQIVADERDSGIPGAIGYFKAHAPRIREQLDALSALAKDPTVPFFAVISVNEQVSRMFGDLNEALDLTSGRKVTVSELLGAQPR